MEQRKEILKVLNDLIELEIHDKSDFNALENEEYLLGDAGLDSFDFIMIFLKIGEAYGIKDKVFKEKLIDPNPTVGTIIDFLLEHKTSYKTYDEIMNVK